MSQSIRLCGIAALLFAVGCGGDKTPTKAPPEVNTDVPVLDIDLGGDTKGSSDTDAKPEPDTDSGPSKSSKGDSPGSASSPDESKSQLKPEPPPAGDGAGVKADAGFGHLIVTFKADKYVAPSSFAAAAATCGAPVASEALVIDKDSLALANVACWLNEDSPKIHPSYEKVKNAKVPMDNVKCRFEPNIATLWTTQTLVIGNKDNFGHNSKVDAFDNKSINPIIPAGASVEAKFTNEETVPVTVSCNIHSWMKGFIVVKSHPLMGVSGADGKLTIENVEAGEHNFRFWHNSGYITKVKVDGTEVDWKKGRVDLDIPDGGALQMIVEIAADSLQ